MPMTSRQKMNMIMGDRLAIHGATTPNLSALYPFFPEGGLVDPRTGRKLPGVTRGWCGLERSGGLFKWLPGACYDAGLVSDRNVIVTGRVGKGKSTWAKTFARRAAALGYKFLILDPHGEYSKLVAAVPGAKELKFGGDTKIYLNPLDSRMLDDQRGIESQLSLLESYAITLMPDHDVLSTKERALLRWAIKDCHEHFGPGARGTPTLPALVEKLFKPSQYMIDGMRRNEGFVSDLGIDMALGLQDLTDGTLTGMFDHETSSGVYEDTPIMVLNLKELDETALRLMARTFNFLTSSQFGMQTGAGQFDFIVIDEAWQLANDPFFINSMIRNMKVGRKQGKSVIYIVHRLYSLMISVAREVVLEMLNDTGTIISYNQRRETLNAVADLIEFNSSMVEWTARDHKYKAMWKIGNQPGIVVEDVLWDSEREMVKTDPESRRREEEHEAEEDREFEQLQLDH